MVLFVLGVVMIYVILNQKKKILIKSYFNKIIGGFQPVFYILILKYGINIFIFKLNNKQIMREEKNGCDRRKMYKMWKNLFKRDISSKEM